jgi:hypothetical protein
MLAVDRDDRLGCSVPCGTINYTGSIKGQQGFF